MIKKKKTKKTKAIVIPERIKDFNFVLLGGDDGKKPFEKGWQKKTHRIDDLQLQEHLKSGKNYGVRCGSTSPVVIDGKSYSLLVVDFDNEQIQNEILPKLPKTFPIKTGGKGLLHLYFASDDDKSFKVFDEKMNTLLDVQGEGKQVVAAGSINPKTKRAYELVDDIPIVFIPYPELKALVMSYDKSPKKAAKPAKQYTPKGVSNDITSKVLNSVSVRDVLVELGIDTTKNPTGCYFHSSVGGKCLSWNNETAHCFHCQAEHEGWNAYTLIRQAKNLTDKEVFNWFAEKSGMMEELKKSRKEFIQQETKQESHDLKTFIFNEEEIIQTRVFTSHLLNYNLFGFGLLLPRTEDIVNKKGEVLGQQQKWRAVVINSEHRGLAVSKWFQTEYKINYEEIPYEMKLRWKLKDIDDFLHNPKQTKINGKDLFGSIKNQYDSYLYFRSKEWYKVHVLWDMGTYLHQLFSAYPLFENRGLTGTAKTKTMVVSSYITLNATDIMTNPSEATLFRETELIRPTKYIDEAEKLFRFTKEGMEADNRVELINSSYTRNGSVPRQEKLEGKYFTKWFHVYSPTMISSINGLYGSTENRAITQIHTKAPDDDIRGERDPEDDINKEEWKIIRNNCYRWALENWKEIYEEYLNFDIKTNLKKRDLQIWKPLLVLAKIINEKELMPEIITFAEKLSAQRKNDNLVEGSLDYKYLSCLNYLLLNNTSDKIYVDSIRERYNQMYGTNEEKKSNKSISVHLDKLGFKELRNRDKQASYYQITKTIFDEIINPLTNDFTETKEKKPLSTLSTLSTQLQVNNDKIDGECMVNDGECNKKEKIKDGEYVDNGENGESPEQEGIISTCNISTNFEDSNIKELAEGEKNG